MGGASSVLTADTREEAIKKAVEWYEGALKAGLYPRDFIYGKGETKIEVEVRGEKYEAYIHVVDTLNKPEHAESKHPFPYFSKFRKDEELKKRFHVFVSAHA